MRSGAILLFSNPRPRYSASERARFANALETQSRMLKAEHVQRWPGHKFLRRTTYSIQFAGMLSGVYSISTSLHRMPVSVESLASTEVLATVFAEASAGLAKLADAGAMYKVSTCMTRRRQPWLVPLFKLTTGSRWRIPVDNGVSIVDDLIPCVWTSSFK